jgi:putative mRNA 3-end processing factor
MSALLQATDKGLYCLQGDFHVDPWQPVARAVITHGHADHVLAGCGAYLTTETGALVLKERLGADAKVEACKYADPLAMNDVRVSLHPAGHMLGSAQVRIESNGNVWVVSGDYKMEADGTCDPFEPVRCNVFITEATYALPIYHWPLQHVIFEEIHEWWRRNQASGVTSVLFAYAVGKAQRLLFGLDPSIGPILVHGGVARYSSVYEAAGVRLAPAHHAEPERVKSTHGRALIIAPPSTAGSPWLRKFAPYSTAFASGWMRIQGIRRRKVLDRGFVLSDHADWPGLLSAIEATRAETVGAHHGYAAPLARWLQERGKEAFILPSPHKSEERDRED